jgi:hypothetical protein
MEDVTIIIQGRVSPETISDWILYYSSWNVIISTWSDQNISEFDFPENWTIIKRPVPKRIPIGGNNFDLQVNSTLAGLHYVETEYCIKVRGDEFYSDLDLIINEVKVNPNRIYCSNIFFRAYGENTHYHISDHLLASNTQNIKDLFGNAMELLKSGYKLPESFDILQTPESYLGFSFVQYKENISLENPYPYLNKDVSIMLTNKWFGVYPVNLFNKSVISYNGVKYFGLHKLEGSFSND